MATYGVNDAGMSKARRLTDSGQYVLASDWGRVRPSADAENADLERNGWEACSQSHLAVTQGAAASTKAAVALPLGGLRRVHRKGLIACRYRAAEFGHKDVELVAHELPQHLDAARAGERRLTRTRRRAGRRGPRTLPR